MFGTNITLNESGINSGLNIQNAGSGTATVNMFHDGNYVGLLGGAGYTVNGSGGTVATWANTSYDARGDRNNLGIASGSGTLNATGNGNTVNGGDGLSVNVTGSGGLIYIGVNSGANVTGTYNTVVEGSGSFTNLIGDHDTASAAGTGGFNIIGQSDTVAVSNGAYVGVVSGSRNATVFGSYGMVQTQDNVGVTVVGTGETVNGASASMYAVLGDGNTLTVETGSTGLPCGTNITLNKNGANSGINVQNVGYGGTNGNAVVSINGTGNYVGLLDGKSYSVFGNGGTVQGYYNTQFAVFGNNNAVGAATGDTAGIAGGGNSIFAGADTSVFVNTVAGSTNTIVASNDKAGDPTALGTNPASLSWVTGSRSRWGDGNAVTALQGAQLEVYGNSNQVVAGAATLIGITGSSNNINSLSRGIDFITGSGNTVTANGTMVVPLDGNYVAVAGNVSNPAQLNGLLVQSREVVNAIDEAYGEVLGRGADPAGLAGAQTFLANGGTLAQFRYGLGARRWNHPSQRRAAARHAEHLRGNRCRWADARRVGCVRIAHVVLLHVTDHPDR